MKKYSLGIDLGGTNIKTALFDEGFGKMGENRTDTRAELGSEAVLERIGECAEALLEQAGVSMEEVCCAGMGVPGLMDIEAGISQFSPNFPDWENVRISGYFQERWGIPVAIDNDVRVHLYGEWQFGAGRGKRNLLLLALGTGLGGGVMIDGHILYGATNSVGEIGHMNMYRRQGRPCRCGSSGCFGRYVSALGMIRTFREKLEAGQRSIVCDWVDGNQEKITAKMISEAYDAGDQTAVDTLRETGELLGYGMANLINLYNPERLIVGGGMSAAGERLLAPARETVRAHAIEITRRACDIVVAELGDGAGMLGAAYRARSKMASGSAVI